MRLKPLILVPAAACAVLLVGCSSNDTASDSANSSVAQSAADAPAGSVVSKACPTGTAGADTAAEWTVEGTTGSVSVVGQTDSNAPLVTVTTPFAVDETAVKVLHEGDGATVTESSTVSVCYVGVDGRDGTTFDSAYQRGEAADFPAAGVIPGFQQALVGQKVGSSVAVVIPSKDGYPQGTPDGSIKPGDTLIFALKILTAQ
ncbi:MAG: FKBP-type peptidyl-prolyl cis-trans isomerase [Gordonia sp. (in: high G+C Gram-positive bacteria)]|uniref:FKBP-type peptidyl-prolyl cis-trans isomerase n=1 Tax=Gordonia sp. (in: high G+C Gram-positive bacteria) TaxID=84139 RepID=UPI003BB5B2DF